MARLEIISSDEANGAEISELRELAERWEGRAVIAQFDAPTRSWFFVAIHDETLGQAAGGTRMCAYARPADALRDAMRLAEAMTHKWAVIDFDFGGGKAVLAVTRRPEGEERAGLLERFGMLLEGLGGRFSTGEDLGTTPADIIRLAAVTRHVNGVDRSTGRMVEPGPYTALGIFGGMRAALAQAYGEERVRGRSVLVEGLGHVGEPLARLLCEEGAEVILCDVDEERMRGLAGELGCRRVAPGLVHQTRSDIYAPCARGGTLSRRSALELSCRIVAGAANNQLEDASVADLLHERRILYAPDYVINAGGAIAVSLRHRGASEPEARERVERIATTLGQIFEEAASREESPLHAAERKVMRVLASAREEKSLKGESRASIS